MSTTIRVDKKTHALLVRLSENEQASLIDTVKEAAEALKRVRFGQKVAAEYSALRANNDEWKSYMQEVASTEAIDDSY